MTNARFYVVLFALAGAAGAAEVSVLNVSGLALKGNPLGDPVDRKVVVVSPDGVAPDRQLPLLVYLPGWGGSPDDTLKAGAGSVQATVVQRLSDAGLPLRIAVVDGRSRYGGSQFLNSTATGNYADYIVSDVIPAVERKYASVTSRRLIGGHSSGGYGALMLAIARKETFQAVVALSPDSDFETTHKPIAQEPGVRAVRRADLEAAMAPPGKSRMPADETAQLVMGLSANYTPSADHAGRFDWLYDESGAWRPEVWQRWIALDPLTVVTRSPDAFAPANPVYLDGAELDEFGANIGARKIHDVLKGRAQKVSFYQSPGHHSEHLAERLERGLRWALAALPEK